MYQARLPHPALRSFIESYFFVEPRAGMPLELHQELFVDARLYMVFNFGDPYMRYQMHHANDTEQETGSLLYSRKDFAMGVRQSGLIHVAGVQFWPGGAAACLPMNMHEVTDLRPDEAFGQAGRDLEEQLYCADSVDAAAACFDAFFLAFINSPTLHNVAHYVITAIDRAYGQLNLTAIAEKTAYSPRSIERFVRQIVGVSPKFYARVVRFRTATTMLESNPDMTITAVAHACNYHDASHFIRDCKAFSTYTPAQYIARMAAIKSGDWHPVANLQS